MRVCVFVCVCAFLMCSEVERTRSEATAAIAEVTLEEIVLDTVGEDTQKLDEFLNN